MHIYDRLYGDMQFPELIRNLLNCPALLRLRDVRMANNQFEAFPSFSNASRYEHSLGVCYLADICAKSLSLAEKDRIELMMACLYHDVGTPPFAHAMEEVLQAEYGFDHEKNLKYLIEGTNNSYIGNLDQIYCGESIKLHSVCQSKEGRRLGLDVHRIAQIIVGDKSEPLSFLLNGNGMDLDNIDNIVRASTAMGIIDLNYSDLAKKLASSFLFLEDGSIGHNALFMNDIKKWQQIRDIQYTAIFDSVNDFAYQTMIKKALRILIEDKESEYRLDANSWKLTDSEIIHEYLLKNTESKQIMKNVMLERPFRCLGVLYIAGENVVEYINTHIVEIESVSSDFYKRITGLNLTNDMGKFLSPVMANFYPDKRKRSIKSEAMLFGNMVQIDDCAEKKQGGALLGLFTPFISGSYKTIELADGRKVRKKMSFSSKDLRDLIVLLCDSIFKEYEVTIYGKRNNTRESKETKEYQLGFL